MNRCKTTLLDLLFLVALPMPVLGQTALNSTTLNEAVDGTETRIDITSTTNVSVNDIAFVDREAMLVLRVDSNFNRIRVRRGFAGTVAGNHSNGQTIWIDKPDRFISKNLSGACTAGSEFPNYTPLINTSNGNIYRCQGGIWDLEQISGVGYDEVLDEGTGVTKRPQINFIGAQIDCVDDAGNTRTNCTILGGGGTFTGLSDSPANYSGSGGYFVKVNSTPDAVEFIQNIGASDFGSQTANFFLAAPNGSAGVPTFRAPVADDLPNVEGLNTSLTAARCVRINAGGTAIEAAAADCGTGSPGGADTQVQVNATGAFAGYSNFTFDKVDTLSVPKLVLPLGTITADAQALSSTATWNNAPTAFTLWKANVTDTASAAGSLLVDLQVGGTSQFKVDKAGVVTAGSSTAGGVSQLGGASDTGASALRIYGGDGASNVEPGYLWLHQSATGEDAFLFPCNTDGQFCISGTTPTADSTGIIMTRANEVFKCNFFLYNGGSALADTDDLIAVSDCSRPGRAITITEVIAVTDAGSPVINLQRDDGSPANLLSSNCTATTGGATCTIDAAEDNFASTDKMDFVAVSALSGATQVSILIEYTVD